MKKIVYESLYEFRRGVNPSDALKLGKKKEVEAFLKEYLFSSGYRINQDWTIDLPKGFTMPSGSWMTELPEYINFNECFGNFLWRDGHLKSMQGFPRVIHGDFMVDGNKLADLDGSPEIVEGVYFIKRNDTKFTVDQIKKVCQVTGRIAV